MLVETLLDQNRWNLYRKNSHSSNSIFISKEIADLPKNEIFPRRTSHPTIPDIDIISKINLTNDVSQADYVLVPHSWRNIMKNHAYLSYLNQLSRDTPILIVNSGDVSPRCTLNNKLELRTFIHPWENLNRKIVLPYPVKGKQFIIKSWKPKPKISFIGYVPKFGPGSLLGENVQGLLNPIKSSVYLNRKISAFRLKKLKSRFDVYFQARSTFTAYTSNPNLEKHVLEYDKVLSLSDYVLCPRGAGNVSMRFFETLSSGTTPILIKSGGQFPILQEDEFWNNNVINLGLFENWVDIISEDWAHLGIGQNYVNRQSQNNMVFLKQLKFEVYLEKLFKKYLRTL
jgi:hypothetical protein